MQHLNETINLAESQVPEDLEHSSSLTVDALEAVVADAAVRTDVSIRTV